MYILYSISPPSVIEDVKENLKKIIREEINEHSNLGFIFQARYAYHYTKIIVVCACVRTDRRSPEVYSPWPKKLCFFAKLESGAATSGSRTRPAMVLALD